MHVLHLPSIRGIVGILRTGRSAHRRRGGNRRVYLGQAAPLLQPMQALRVHDALLGGAGYGAAGGGQLSDV